MSPASNRLSRVIKRRASVIVQEPAEPLTTVQPMAAIDRRGAVDEFVAYLPSPGPAGDALALGLD